MQENSYVLFMFAILNIIMIVGNFMPIHASKNMNFELACCRRRAPNNITTYKKIDPLPEIEKKDKKSQTLPIIRFCSGDAKVKAGFVINEDGTIRIPFFYAKKLIDELNSSGKDRAYISEVILDKLPTEITGMGYYLIKIPQEASKATEAYQIISGPKPWFSILKELSSCCREINSLRKNALKKEQVNYEEDSSYKDLFIKCRSLSLELSYLIANTKGKIKAIQNSNVFRNHFKQQFTLLSAYSLIGIFCEEYGKNFKSSPVFDEVLFPNRYPSDELYACIADVLESIQSTLSHLPMPIFPCAVPKWIGKVMSFSPVSEIDFTPLGFNEHFSHITWLSSISSWIIPTSKDKQLDYLIPMSFSRCSGTRVLHYFWIIFLLEKSYLQFTDEMDTMISKAILLQYYKKQLDFELPTSLKKLFVKGPKEYNSELWVLNPYNWKDAVYPQIISVIKKQYDEGNFHNSLVFIFRMIFTLYDCHKDLEKVNLQIDKTESHFEREFLRNVFKNRLKRAKNDLQEQKDYLSKDLRNKELFIDLLTSCLRAIYETCPSSGDLLGELEDLLN